jgi:hypothetical protein
MKDGSKTLSDDDVRELTRLREFVEEFRSLIDMYDRTPPRWKYFQTQWLWMYARGMVEGEVPASVKTRRLAELHTKEETGDEEAAMLRETDKTIVHLVRGELYGGPGDGGCVHLRLPLRDNIVVRLPSTGGETLDANYRRAAGTLGDIVQIPMDRICRDNDIENAFNGKKSAKYIYVSPSED